MNSLDPRVIRLPDIGEVGRINPKPALDQFGTYEVFVLPKEGKPFQHEGIVHAPNLEMAYVLAKETFTRRFTCASLYVVNTLDVFVSPLSEGNQNVYDQIPQILNQNSAKVNYEIYHLPKRGKQHVHVGRVSASSPEEAFSIAKEQFQKEKIVYNVWVIQSTAIRYTMNEEKDLWLTLPEKKFRDAAEYKGGEKLKEFLKKSKR
ncbi:MAG: phenylacetic acid degradation b [Bacteroidia bacterium]|nr:phenylacetic acid degradation b [Bacteroidia bacterium]